MIKNKKVLIIGDSMLDHYIYINPKKISTEYPGLVFNYEKELFKLGGAANVALNLSVNNVKVELLSLVGNDNNMNILKNILKKHKINSKLIVNNNYKTITKTRYCSLDNKQVFRVDSEIDYYNNEKDIIEQIEKTINNQDLIIISDYRKGIITNYAYKKIIELASINNIKVICDPKDNKVKYNNLFLLKPNKNEMENLLNDTINYKKIIKYKNKNNINNIILTLGSKGLILINDKNKIIEFNAIKKDIYDVTGAGDVVISFIALGILNNLSIEEIAKISNIAGALKVNKFGTSIVLIQEVMNEINNSKLIEIDDLEKICNDSRDKKIVFTNGCFDILHSGHLHLLKEASKLGDILILGINSDNSIKRLKGEKRPINQLQERVKNLSYLDFLDYIVVFDENTPLNIIKTIKPNILVKGEDYKNKYIIGSDEVISSGGKVELIKLVQNKSTTNIIRKIREL